MQPAENLDHLRKAKESLGKKITDKQATSSSF